MKRVLTLLLILMACMLSLVACGDKVEEEPHVHTFETDWSKDDQGHWYEPSCDCTDIQVTKLNHTDKNNDGACDICEQITACKDGHTYAEEWTVDCTNHWHAADCGHVVAGSGTEAHADGNADGKCDVCAYVIEDIHVHYFDSEWSNDAANHWHASLCEHKNEIADKAAHEVNAAGYCTVCDAKVKEITKSDIAAMLNAAIANNFKVVDGSIRASQLVYSGAGNDRYLSADLVDDIYFVLGDGASYVYWKTLNIEGECIGAVENWYELVGEDEVFGAERQLGDYTIVPVSAALNHLNGYTYNPGSILPGMDVDTTTLANTLSALYALKTANVRVSDSTESYDAATGVYSFAFKYFTVNATKLKDDTMDYQVEVYHVNAKFTIDDNFVIDSCNLEVSVYRNVEQDMDLDYDPENDKYELRADANPSVYSYEVIQHSGERTYTNPYPKASLMPIDFDFFTADVEILLDEDEVAYHNVILKNKVNKTINATAETTLYLAISNIKPSAGSPAFITIGDFDISFVNKTTGAEGVLFVPSEYNPSYSHMWNYGYIALFVKDAGTYTLTVKYGDVVKSFEVVVTEKETVDLEAGEGEILVETTETYGYEDLYTFTATDGEGKYTFTVPAGLGFCSKEHFDSLKAPEFDLFAPVDPGTDVMVPHDIVVELEANEEYQFYVGAYEKKQWLIAYTYEACDVEDDGQGGAGDNGYDTVIVVGANTLCFSADEIAANAAERKVTISAAGTYQFAAGNLFVANLVAADGTVISKNAEYNFELEAGEYTVTFSMFSNFGVVADVAYNLNVNDVNAEDNEEPEEPENPETSVSLAGTYTATDEWENSFTVVITDTTITFTPPRSPEIVLTYEYDGTTVTLYSDGNPVTNPLSGALTAEGTVAKTLSYNGTDYTLTAATGGGDQGGDDPQPSLPALNVGANNVTLNEEEAVSGKTYSFAVTEEGTYTFVGDLFAIVLDSTGMEAGRGSVYLAVGNYTVNLVNFAEAAGDFVVTVNFQAPATGGEEGDGTESAPYVWSEIPESVTINSDTINKIYYLYTATASGTITFTWPTNDSWGDWYLMDGEYTTATSGSSNEITTMVVPVVVGETYRIGIGTYNEAGEFTITVAFAAGEGGDQGGDDPQLNIEGTYYGVDSYGNQLLTVVIDATTVTFNYNHPMMGPSTATYDYEIVDGAVVLTENGNEVPMLAAFITLQEGVPAVAGYNGNEYTLSTTQGGGEESNGSGTESDPYVLDETGDYVCAFPGGYSPIFYAFTPSESGNVTVSTSFSTGWLMVGTNLMNLASNEGSGASVTAYVTAGTLCYIGVADWDEAENDVPFTVSFVAGDGEEEEDDEIVVKQNINDGFENTVEITEQEKEAGTIYLGFTPDQSGEYLFAGDLFVTSAIDSEGNILEKNEDGCFVFQAWNNYTLVTSTAYVFEAGMIGITPQYQYPEGHQNNPIGWFDITASVTASYPGNYAPAIWYYFYADATGTVTVTSDLAGSTVMVGSDPSCPAEGDGSVTLSVVSGKKYYVGVCNFMSTDAAEITLSIAITEGEYVGDGSMNTPYELVLGENTATLASFGGEVYYQIKVTANGTLTVSSTTDKAFGWWLSTELVGNEAVTGELTLQVEMDSIVYLYLGNQDWTSTEDAVIPFNVSFEADPMEVGYEDIVYTDGTVNVIDVAENTWVSLGFYGMGNFVIAWDNADARVELADFFMPNTPLANGQTIEGSNWGVTLIVYLPDYAAGTVNLTITQSVAPAQEIVLGDSIISVTDTQMGNSVSFTAPETNNYVFVVGVNGVLVYDYTNYFAGEPFEIALEEGETVNFNIATEDFSQSDVTLTVTIAEESAPSAVGEYRYLPDPENAFHRWQLVLDEVGTGTLKEQTFDSSDFSWTTNAEFSLTYGIVASIAGGIDVTIDFADGAAAADGTYSMGTVQDTDGIVGIILNGTAVDFFLYE